MTRKYISGCIQIRAILNYFLKAFILNLSYINSSIPRSK